MSIDEIRRRRRREGQNIEETILTRLTEVQKQDQYQIITKSRYNQKYKQRAYVP